MQNMDESHCHQVEQKTQKNKQEHAKLMHHVQNKGKGYPCDGF